MMKIGHRGACGYEPENTLRSFNKALDLGVDMVEMDAHVCRSGEVVLIHDDTVDRTTDGHGHVADMMFTDLSRLDAGHGEKIPTLEQALEDEVQKTTEKLQELQKARGAGAKSAQLMTPEQQLEIENFRKRVTETRKELKELRKNLRQDAEALVFWTKVANIALVPLLVVLLGLAVFFVKRRKQSPSA